MQYRDLQVYIPQKMFLIQADEKAHGELVMSAGESYTTVQTLSVPRFTIEHAHVIVEFLTEGNGEERICIVYFSVFSPDAAQVLLKALEEPDENTTVVFMTTHPYLVPSTIRSRVVLLALESSDATSSDTALFTTKKLALEYIAKEFSSDSDEDAATKRARAVALLDALERFVSNNTVASEVIYTAKHMLFKANMPTKYVLEYAINLAL